MFLVKRLYARTRVRSTFSTHRETSVRAATNTSDLKMKDGETAIVPIVKRGREKIAE